MFVCKRIQFIFVIYNLVLLTILAVIFGNVGIFFVGCIGMCILLACCVNIDSEIYKVLFKIILIAVIYLLFHYVALIERWQEPYYGSDDKVFERYGTVIYESGALWFSSMKVVPGYTNSGGYFLFLAWMIRISNWYGEYSTISPRIFNIYLWIAVAVLVYKYMLSINSDAKKIAQDIMFGLAVFPNALYISSHVYRDTMVAFFIFFSIYLVRVISLNTQKIRYILFGGAICVFNIYSLYFLRRNIVMIVVAQMVVELFWNYKEIEKFNNIRNIIRRLSIGLFGLIGIGVYGGGNLIQGMVERYSEYRIDHTDGLSSVVFSTSIFPFGIFLRIIWGMMVPFPGAMFSFDFLKHFKYSIISTFNCLGTMLQMTLLPLVFKAISRFDKEAVNFMIIFLSIVASTFTFRHFIMIYPFMAIELYKGYINTNIYMRRQYLKFAFIITCTILFAYGAIRLI